MNGWKTKANDILVIFSLFSFHEHRRNSINPLKREKKECCILYSILEYITCNYRSTKTTIRSDGQVEMEFKNKKRNSKLDEKEEECIRVEKWFKSKNKREN